MGDMNLFCIVVLGLLLLFFVWRFLSGRRPAPPGTYDDPDVRSGGSFGGSRGKQGQSSYDDPDVRSGGSFGGTGKKPGQSSYDDPDVSSGGSIGGRQRTEPPAERPASPPKRMDDGGIPKGRSSRPSSSSSSTDSDDDPDVRSGGSFGG